MTEETEATSKFDKRQLQLLLAMDRARDSIDAEGDPMEMFQRMVRLLKEHFAADAAAIVLFDAQRDVPELVTTIGMPQDMAISLAREALEFSSPRPISSSAWQHTLGLRILIDREGQVPGAVVLAQDARPFAAEAQQLLQLAESQIDSAVVQARTIWRLAERNRELEAIYQIDRLRDDSNDEETLLANLSSLLTRYFQASFCHFLLSDRPDHSLHVADDEAPEFSTAARETLVDLARELQTTTALEAPEPLQEHCQHVLAAPFIVAGERLGAVVIGRDSSFDINDTRLMVAMTSQINSAIAKSRAAAQLQRRKRELEAIYRIDQIRDREDDFDTMLRRVLAELCQVISSETGYLMLYNADQEDPLEIRATTREQLLKRPDYLQVIRRLSREALDTEQVVMRNEMTGAIHSLIAVPLILNERIIGVFGAVNSNNPRGFSRDDARMLSAITSQVDTAVFERLERRRLRQVLSRSVDPKVLEALLTRADDSLLTGERVIISLLFADLRGSTEWAEHTAPEELVSLLNQFLGMMTDVIFKYSGTLDKFVGDEVIALFGSPVAMPDHAYKAAQAALEMQSVHQRVRAELSRQGRTLPPMGIGISTGEVIAGEFGPPIRTDYTAMGRVMNLGSRLCSAADADQILISETTHQELGERAYTRPIEPVTLKGIEDPVHTYELLRLNE